MPKGRLVFDGDNIYTEKDARIYKLKTSVSSKIDAIPGVVDSLDSTSSTDALSANMGRQLQDQINSLSGTGKFLSTWDCTTGLPGTNPQEDPYTYKVGDYYVVSATGSTNYKPHGGTYTQGVPSTTVELENVGVNDKYYFDGADWVRIPDTSIQISVDSALSTTSTNAVENRAITNAINTKQNIISDLNDIRSGAAAGSTALQRLDNITELTNNAGYQTAGDVTNIVNNIISTVAPDGVGAGILTLQKNATTVDTFSANATQNKTINITVPTTVAELSDSNDYATKADVAGDLADYVQTSDLGAAAFSNDYNDLDNKPTQQTVNNGMLTIKRNNVNVTTFTANQSTNATANINVPTTVAELSDANNYATKTYVDDKMSSGSTAPVNPVEGQIWYDITNHILKIYNGTDWVPVDTGTTYTAGEGIAILNGNDYSAMRGPCPEGFHVPTKDEWVNLIGILISTFGLTNGNATLKTYLKMPIIGRRHKNDSTPDGDYSTAYYWSCTYGTTLVYYLNSVTNGIYSSSTIDGAYGLSVRGFKDVSVTPAGSSWIELFSYNDGGIYHNATLGLISISSDGIDWITIADKNVGATTVYNNGDTPSEANCGKYYQRGNNYGFPFSGNVLTDNTQVDASTYGPGNYYSSSTFIIGNDSWDSSINKNLWGGVTGVVQLHNAITSTQLSDATFSSSWDGDTTHAPSKNAIYDVLGDVETLLANL